MSTAYVLKITEPEARRAEISLEADTRGAASMEARLPVWTPGSYLVREHQRHVDGVRLLRRPRRRAVRGADRGAGRVADLGGAPAARRRFPRGGLRRAGGQPVRDGTAHFARAPLLRRAGRPARAGGVGPGRLRRAPRGPGRREDR